MYSAPAVREQLHYKNRTDIKKKALPFFYSANNKDNLAILVHGFSGTPYDLQELGQFLAANGINAQGVLLAGHGGNFEFLEQSNHHDWWASVKAEIDANEHQYKNIYLIGYSFGSNIILDICSRYPKIAKGVVCLGSSLFIKKGQISRILLPFVGLYKKSYSKIRANKTTKALYESRGSHIKLPIKAIKSFFYFIDNYTFKQLGQFTAPVLLIHSRDDSTSQARSSEWIFENISSEDKELFILNEFDHNPLNSRSRDAIFDKVLTFIKDH